MFGSFTFSSNTTDPFINAAFISSENPFSLSISTSDKRLDDMFYDNKSEISSQSENFARSELINTDLNVLPCSNLFQIIKDINTLSILHTGVEKTIGKSNKENNIFNGTYSQDENLRNNNKQEEEKNLNHFIEINNDTSSQNSDNIQLDMEDDFDNIPIRHSLIGSTKINGDNNVFYSQFHKSPMNFSVITQTHEEIGNENYINSFDVDESIIFDQSLYTNEYQNGLNDYSSTRILSERKNNNLNILFENSIKNIDDDDDEEDEHDQKILSLTSMSHSSSLNSSYDTEPSSNSFDHVEQTNNISLKDKSIEDNDDVDDDDVMNWKDENILLSSSKSPIKDILPPHFIAHDTVGFIDSSKTPSESSERLSIGYEDDKNSDYELTNSEDIDYDPLDDQHSTGSLHETFDSDEFNTDNGHDPWIESTKQMNQVIDVRKTDNREYYPTSHISDNNELIIHDDNVRFTYMTSARSPVSDYDDSNFKLEIHLENDINQSQQLSSSQSSIMTLSSSSTSSELYNVNDDFSHNNIQQDNSVIVAMDADEIDENNKFLNSSNEFEPRITSSPYHDDIVENRLLESKSTDRLTVPIATTEFEDDNNNLSRIESDEIPAVVTLKQQYINDNTILKNLLFTQFSSSSNVNYLTDLRHISRTTGIVQDILDLRNLMIEHENDDEFVAVMHNPTMFEEVLHNNDIQQIHTNDDHKENEDDKNSIQKLQLFKQENQDLLNSVSMNEHQSTYLNIIDGHNEIPYPNVVLSHSINGNDVITNDGHKSTIVVNNSTREKIENEIDNNNDSYDNVTNNNNNNNNNIEQLVCIFNAIRLSSNINMIRNNSSSDDDDDLLQTLAKIHSINENVNRTPVEKVLKSSRDNNLLFSTIIDSQISNTNLLLDQKQDVETRSVQQSDEQDEENIIVNYINIKEAKLSPSLQQEREEENNFFKPNKHRFTLSNNHNHNTIITNMKRREEQDVNIKQHMEENNLFNNFSSSTAHNTGDVMKEEKRIFSQGKINEEDVDRKEKYTTFTNQINNDDDDNDIKKQDAFLHKQLKQNIEKKEEKNITLKYLQLDNKNSTNDSSTSTSFTLKDTIMTSISSSTNVSNKHLKSNDNTLDTLISVNNHIMDNLSTTLPIMNNEPQQQQSIEGLLQMASAVFLNPFNKKTETQSIDDNVTDKSKNFVSSTTKNQSSTFQNKDDDLVVQKPIDDFDTLWNETLSFLPDVKHLNETKNENLSEPLYVDNNSLNSFAWNDLKAIATTETTQSDQIDNIDQWLNHKTDEINKADKIQKSTRSSNTISDDLLVDFNDNNDNKQVKQTETFQFNKEHNGSTNPFSVNFHFNPATVVIDKLGKTLDEHDEMINEQLKKSDEHINDAKDKQNGFHPLFKLNESNINEMANPFGDTITQVNATNNDMADVSFVIQPINGTEQSEKSFDKTSTIESTSVPHIDSITANQSAITPILEQNEKLADNNVSSITHLEQDQVSHNTLKHQNDFLQQLDNTEGNAQQVDVKKNIFDEIKSSNIHQSNTDFSWNALLGENKQMTSSLNPFENNQQPDQLLNWNTADESNSIQSNSDSTKIPSTDAYTWEALFTDMNNTETTPTNLIGNIEQAPVKTTALLDTVDRHVKNNNSEHQLSDDTESNTQLIDTDDTQRISDWNGMNDSTEEANDSQSLDSYLNWVTEHLGENID
ncbi:unnamed protein product, partial [Didymodactylos carnosus]